MILLGRFLCGENNDLLLKIEINISSLLALSTQVYILLFDDAGPEQWDLHAVQIQWLQQQLL